jgi:hypothetical protein
MKAVTAAWADSDNLASATHRQVMAAPTEIAASAAQGPAPPAPLAAPAAPALPETDH